MQVSNDTMHTLRLARDFLIGFVLFLLICSLNLAATEPPAPLWFARAVETSIVATVIQLACAHPAEALANLFPSVPIEHDRELVILGLVFSGMVAVNLWFARHVRGAYARAGQDEWRSG